MAEQTNNFLKFIENVKNKLGPNGVLQGQDVSPYEANISDYVRTIPAVLLPSSVQDVQEIMRLACVHKIPVSPISRGKNWGLGSKLPVSSRTVILDLSRMLKIREINHELGYAVVEPGITQGQLADVLKNQNSRFYLDVTGSGRDTSLVGNILERGIAYNSLRAESVAELEVVLPSGELIRTGYGHYDSAKANHIYKYGIGPSLEGLFFQSGFGVVTAATIHLMPIPEARMSFTLAIEKEAMVPQVMDALRKLMEQSVLRCITHVFNRERFVPAIAPLIKNEAILLDLPSDRISIEHLLANEMSGAWWAVGSTFGTKENVQASQKYLKKELRKFGPLLFMTEGKEALAEKILNLSKALSFARRKLAILRATKPLRGLTKGLPTNATLTSILWPVTSDIEKYNTLEPDLGPGGFLYSVPIVPLTSTDVSCILTLINEIGKKFAFNPAVTLNAATARFIEVVMSIDYPRSDQLAVKRAQACIREMNECFIRQGYIPYRLDINNIDLVVNEKDSFWETVAKLKLTLDPDRILAPGRFDGIRRNLD